MSVVLEYDTRGEIDLLMAEELELNLGLLCLFDTGFFRGEFCHSIDIVNDDDDQYPGLLLIYNDDKYDID